MAHSHTEDVTAPIYMDVGDSEPSTGIDQELVQRLGQLEAVMVINPQIQLAVYCMTMLLVLQQLHKLLL